ncbi:acetate/propionate family kinase [Rothia aerolata]|uniref:Acetate kinase n=1 Tax=Rothia aerolata TaxID=1812262 RepID=A0A917IXG6_9MICC|nr:acetate kinase [Rothia aerolata]GGH65581.1 acetate kinase [Rothia aerolata]
MLILVVNCGSSSIKYQVRDTNFDNDDQAVITKGLIENIGVDLPDHDAALEIMAEKLDEALGDREIEAVGHRVVHGGERFSEPVLVNNEIIRAIERLAPLAPLHNPAHAKGLRAVARKWPSLPQVVVFDTAFHRTMPEHVWRYAVPEEFYTLHGIRRYGFHGTSHDYVTGIAAELLGIDRSEFNAVIAHLGNGASVTAIKEGKSVDTSMGYTPLAGLVMGTRSGDIDPSVLTSFMERNPEVSAADMNRILNNESGLLAIAGSNDMRKVVEAKESGDSRAQLALDMTAYRLAKYIGGYHVAVGGMQALVFTAGIGENSAEFRALAVEQLGALGIKIDPELNAIRSDEPRVISTEDSLVKVLVVPTNEEKAIALATKDVVNQIWPDRG